MAPLSVALVLLSVGISGALPSGTRTGSTELKRSLQPIVLAASKDVPSVQFESRRPRWRLRGSLRTKQPVVDTQLASTEAAAVRTATGSTLQEQVQDGVERQGLAEALHTWEEAAATAAASAAAQEAASLRALHGEEGAALSESQVFGGTPSVHQRGMAIMSGQVPLSGSSLLLDHSEEQLSERLRVENERLRAENSRLRDEEAFLHAESSQLQRGEAALREEQVALKAEDSRLRRLSASYSASLAAARSMAAQYHSSAASALLGVTDQNGVTLTRAHAILLCVSFGIALLMLLCAFGHVLEEDSDSESDSDDEEAAGMQLRSLLKPSPEKRKGWRLCQCCNGAVARFFMIVLLVTVVGGAVLWKTGILQPILAQCIMYVYITAIVAGGLTLMVMQLWRLIRKVTTYIIKEFDRLKKVFGPIFHGHGVRTKFRDFLDDGKMNSSYFHPGARGRRRGTTGGSKGVGG